MFLRHIKVIDIKRSKYIVNYIEFFLDRIDRIYRINY